MRGIRGIVPNGKISGLLFAFRFRASVADFRFVSLHWENPRITLDSFTFTIEIYDR